MRTVNTELVQEYADELREVLPLARRAVGTQRPGSPARRASDRANELILSYSEAKGNMTHLANELGPEVISLPGLRRRLRAARSGRMLGSFSTSPRRGTTDPARVGEAADKIRKARDTSPEAYRDAVREVYAANVSLSAVAEQLDITYFSLWSAASTS